MKYGKLTLLLGFVFLFCFLSFKTTDAKYKDYGLRRDPGRNKLIHGAISEGIEGCAMAETAGDGVILSNFRDDGGCPSDLEIPTEIFANEYEYIKVEGIKINGCYNSIKVPDGIKIVEIEGGNYCADSVEIGNIYKKIKGENGGDIRTFAADKNGIWDAYNYCGDSFEEIHLFDTVKKIRWHACNVDKLYIPDSVTEIEDHDNLNGVDKLRDALKFNVTSADPKCKKNGGKFGYACGWGRGGLHQLKGPFMIYFGNNVKRIGKFSFAINSAYFHQKEIHFNDSLEYIGDFAFFNRRYKEIELPSNIKYIGTGAFCSDRSVSINKDTTTDLTFDKDGYSWTKVKNPENISPEVRNQFRDACLFTDENEAVVKNFKYQSYQEGSLCKGTFDTDWIKRLHPRCSKTENKQEANLNSKAYDNENSTSIQNDTSVQNFGYNKSESITNNSTSDSIQNDLTKLIKIMNGSNCSISNSTFSSEENSAFQFACQKGLISAKKIQDANLKSTITRAELAKIISLYAINVLGKTLDYSKNCNFSDVSFQLQQTYSNGIEKSCQLGLMGVGIKKFNPYGTISRAEFGTVLSRLLWGNTYNNTGKNWYDGHLTALKNSGILTNTNPNILELRSWVLLMLYRNSSKENNSENLTNTSTKVDTSNDYYAGQNSRSIFL